MRPFCYCKEMFKTIITDTEALKVMIKTKNFNPLTDPKMLCTCGHSKCDKRSVSQFAIDRVQLMRNDAGRPLYLTSGGRCQFHPCEVNKDKPGDHQNCVGVDIYYSNELERNELLVLAGRYGATSVAVGKDFVHVAWRIVNDKRVRTWSYK